MRLGVLSYINSMPLTYGLESRALAFEGEVVRGAPIHLNRLADAGGLDVTPVSSVQFLRSHPHYRVVPGVCLASVGAVQSVRLFSLLPPQELTGRRVAVTCDSATSRILLQVLWPGLQPLDLVGEPLLSAEVPAALLIGDRALRGVEGSHYVVDLGQEWYERTGLPMVFALWLVSCDYLRRPGHLDPARILEASRVWGEQNRAQVLGEAERRTGLGVERLENYYRALTYRLDEPAVAGLAEFYRRSAALGLLPEGGDRLLVEQTAQPIELISGGP